MKKLLDKHSLRHWLRNPLGMMGLFVMLCYSMVVLLFSGGHEAWTAPGERYPFIVFIVLFPFIILAAFVYLVACHHEKLYAPADYRDEKHFFALSAGEKASRYTTKAEEIFGVPVPAGRADRPEGPGAGLVYALANAQHLALQRLEKDYGIRFEENVKFVTATGRTFGLDAVGRKYGRHFAVKCSYVNAPVPEERFCSLLEECGAARDLLAEHGMDAGSILVFVVNSNSRKVAEGLQEYRLRFSSAGGTEIFDYKKLKAEFRSLPLNRKAAGKSASS